VGTRPQNILQALDSAKLFMLIRFTVYIHIKAMHILPTKFGGVFGTKYWQSDTTKECYLMPRYHDPHKNKALLVLGGTMISTIP
jgi:hypothetical protein